jgi:hypothetical protein
MWLLAEKIGYNWSVSEAKGMDCGVIAGFRDTLCGIDEGSI